ncbi:36817_t:CDS:1, partial [Gigaspora margarita]
MATQQLVNNSQELTFLDKQLLINWLCTQPDLIIQVQNLLIEFSPNK